MYFNGSLKLGGAGVGVLFISSEGKQLKYVLQILWQATNNEVEYEALIHRLRITTSLRIKRLLVYRDSTMVINQVNKDLDCTKNNMDAYCAEVRKLEKNFQGLENLHVKRDSNIATDILAKLGLDRAKVPPGVFVEELTSPSIKQPGGITLEPPAPTTQIMVINRSWTQDFIDYIKENKLPDNREEATRIIRRSKNYVIIGDNLYRRAVSSGVLLKCITREEGKEILEEIHPGCCGNHVASRTLVGKTFRAGFYWPIALNDVEELVRQCKWCQMFMRQAHVPAHELICIPLAWPFACWGRDQVGPLKKAKGSFEYILITIDKFTKWIEYKPLVKYSAAKAVEFIQDIMHRFGIPNRIITDLGSPFTAIKFRN
jgi:ribonuclease HI